MVTPPTRSLVLETAYGVGQPRCHSQETPLVLIASVVGMFLEPVPLEADLTAVVAVVEVAVAVVEIAIAAAVAVGSGGFGGPNHSVMMWGTSVEDFDL